MKKIILFILISLLSFFSKAQVIDTLKYTGAVQTWTVPACVTSITVKAAGGAGQCNIILLGGAGAVVTATVTVIPGHVLGVVAGGEALNGAPSYGNFSTTCSGDGGGGGSFVWDKTGSSAATLPLVVAGGGGGAGGQNQAGNPGSTTIAPNNTIHDGAAGTNGSASSNNAATNANGGSGAGWFTATPVPAAASATDGLGQGGLGVPGNFVAGNGALGCAGNPNGAFGGGGGGGQDNTSPGDFGGGGGGGGFNGGGGGDGTIGTNTACYGGGGGGSGYYNGVSPYTTLANFVNPVTVTQNNTNKGYVVITYNCVLPVELLSFDAVYNKTNSAVNLEWVTATETNNKLFSIERSVDGENWETITTVPGAGNSSRVLNYNAIDENPYSGVSYYRLKQTDYDGAESYSYVKSVEIAANYSLSIYPNPTRGNITLSYSSENPDPINVTITDISGRIVTDYKVDDVQQGTNMFQVPTASFSKGMYIMRISNPQKTFYTKFEKE